MAENIVNSSAYRLSVATYDDLTIGDLTAPAWTDFESLTFTKVPYVSGCTVTVDGRTKDITSMGAGPWMQVVRERNGVTLSCTIEHVLDDATDVIEAGHKIIADASAKVGLGNRILVRYEHPFVATQAEELTMGNDLTAVTAGKVTVFAASVLGGNLTMGGGGTNGAFVTSAYDIASFGIVSTVDVS